MSVLPLISRLALAIIFLLSGIDKISNFAAMQGYMNAMGVPGFLLTPTIIFEIVASLSLILGFKARYAALLLAGFSVVTAVIFHSNFSDQIQFILFMKNIAIAGGLLMLVEKGTSRYSIDSFFANREQRLNKASPQVG